MKITVDKMMRALPKRFGDTNSFPLSVALNTDCKKTCNTHAMAFGPPRYVLDKALSRNCAICGAVATNAADGAAFCGAAQKIWNAQANPCQRGRFLKI
jgi:hypothetical protein